MTTITVKNIPPDIYDLLRRSAKENRRSMNSEIIHCIERALRSRKVNPTEVVARARLLRERTTGYQVGDVEFTEAKREGRP